MCGAGSVVGGRGIPFQVIPRNTRLSPRLPGPVGKIRASPTTRFADGSLNPLFVCTFFTLLLGKRGTFLRLPRTGSVSGASPKPRRDVWACEASSLRRDVWSYACVWVGESVGEIGFGGVVLGYVFFWGGPYPRNGGGVGVAHLLTARL